MRLSTNEADPSYWEWRNLLLSSDIRVYLDGAEQKDCTEVDDGLGYVIRHPRDENGDLILDGDIIRSERAEGIVQIKIESRA